MHLVPVHGVLYVHGVATGCRGLFVNTESHIRFHCAAKFIRDLVHGLSGARLRELSEQTTAREDNLSENAVDLPVVLGALLIHPNSQYQYKTHQNKAETNP